MNSFAATLQTQCNVCFESYPVEEMCATACRHLFCKECWGGYVTAEIEKGPGVLDLRCPQPDCSSAVRLASKPSEV